MDQYISDILLLLGWIAILAVCYLLLSRNIDRRKNKF